ncbi:DNA polymerase III subunit delta [bacterium]|nr:MAG: DNA polymerase III subunit delta [bacterium]
MNPAQYIRTFKELSQTSPPAKIFLYGDAKLLKDGLMRAFRKQVEGMEDFALDVFWMNELKSKDDYKVIFDSLLSLPMLSDRRIVILRNFDVSRATEKKIIEGLANFSFPDTAMLIVESESLDMRRKEGRAISKMFRTIELPTPGEREMVEWISYFARRAGKKMTISAAKELINIAGISLAAVREEVEKIVNFVEDDFIRVEDVRQVCAHSRSAHIFQFANAVQSLDFDLAMKLSIKLMNFGEQHSVILSWMNRSLGDLLWAKIDPNGLAKRLGKRAFLAQKIKNAAQPLDREKIISALALLHQADMMVKKSSADPKTAVIWAIARTKEILAE